MALTSPRFKNVPQLTDAAANSPWLSSGSRGHGVHLVQFALIDLGFPMPKSVGGAGFSPDGIYGGETVAKVKEFQRSALGGPAVTDDGCVGANTLAKLDRAIGGFKHTVRVHMLTVRHSALPLLQMENVAKEVYGHYGIKFEVVSGRTISVPAADEAILRDRKASWTDIKRVAAAHASGGLSSTETLVFQIGRFIPDDVYGETLSDSHEAICRISDDATEATLGHEVGHVLLTPASGVDKEDHTPHIHNLMTDKTERPPYVLTIEQVTEMRAHARCV